MEDVFRVTFGCGNCGEEFDDTFPPRVSVEVPHHHSRVHVLDADCDAMLNECDYCGPVQCPTCELYEHVEVEKREPLDDEEVVEGDGGEVAA